MTTKADRMIDDLPDADADAEAVARFVRKLCDPLCRRLMEAPEDDEPETEEERAAVAEAWEDLRAGRVVSDEELRRELGL